MDQPDRGSHVALLARGNTELVDYYEGRTSQHPGSAIDVPDDAA